MRWRRGVVRGVSTAHRSSLIHSCATPGNRVSVGQWVGVLKNQTPAGLLPDRERLDLDIDEVRTSVPTR
jgi:hypothetical protein